jgi:FlaA1/EpsC-like NDP-sugar epimerase
MGGECKLIKKILVTGSCGTIGQSLVSYLLKKYSDCEVLCLDNNESQLFFQEQQYLHEERVKIFLGDIRDLDRMRFVLQSVDIVYHTAALKHVVMCERSPMEAIQSNIHGVNNIIQTATEAGVQKVVFTSSDKAVNPTNVMGTSKLMGERLMTAANTNHQGEGTIFFSTRFGNVLGSTGSVIPIFRKQIEKGTAVTLTDKEMTRFVMSIEQAIELLVDSSEMAKGGEVIITKMPVIRISDLAKVMIEELAPHYGHDPASINVLEIGCKPGEKLYEELMNQEETRRAVELDNYFSVLPAFRDLYRTIHYDYPDVISDEVVNPYISKDESALSKTELRDFLNKFNLLEEKSNS